MTPTLATACASLPPAGANFPWGDPAENCMAPTRGAAYVFLTGIPRG
jgi:hypothetical protein